MNLRDLQYLVAVADHLHFGKAAKTCNVSQPTLSMQLKKLEEYLGVQLFERTNKSVILTGIGKEITIRARYIMEEAEQIRHSAEASKDPLSGEITLGVFPTLAPYLLPSLIPKLKEALPNLNILLVEEKTPELIRRLHNAEIDCALLAMPLTETGLTSYTLFSEPFLLAVSAKHELAKRKSVTFSDIKNETMLLLEDGHCLREQALDVCHKIGSKESNNLRATSMTTLLQMVATSNNVTFIPKLATKENNASFRTIPFKNSPPSRTIGLHIRNSSARKKLFVTIAELTKTIYSTL